MAKPLAESAWKQRCLFYFAGLLFAFACSVPAFLWAHNGTVTPFAWQPDWLLQSKDLLVWVPWSAVFICLIVRFVIGRKIRVGFFFLGVATPVTVLTMWLVFGPIIQDIAHRRNFDAQSWRAQGNTSAAGEDWPPRLCMAEDLVSSGVLHGLLETEVADLLGPPDDHFSRPERSEISFYLGPERGLFRVDSEWLGITFDDDGRVVRCWIWRD